MKKSSNTQLKSKKGQVIIINLLFLFMTIAIFVGMLPAFTTMLNNAKDQNSLNCVSTTRVCDAGAGYPCYNASKDTESLACTAIALYLPYLVIVVLIVGIAKLMSNRITDAFASPAQQQMMYG